MRALPPPEFVKIDPAAIEAELVAWYEAKSGKTLYPAQVERLFTSQIAYAEARVKSAIQHAGEQLLVRFSKGPTLDYLGDLVGVTRLLASSARCTLRFGLPAPALKSVQIAAGTRVCSQDKRVQVATEQVATIAVGQQYAEVAASCGAVGAAGNGWAVGQLNTLVEQSSIGLTVTNSTASSGGADEETDVNLAERICLAPESFSNAGSEGAYIYHVRSVHQSIVAVAVLGPDDGLADGCVALYPLSTDGLPSADLVAQVQAAVSKRKKRPLTDKVSTQAPVEVDYRIRAELTLYATADTPSTLAAAQSAAETYAATLRADLGLDIVPEQLGAALQVPGVYRARVLEPVIRPLARQEWANCTGIELILTEVNNG